MHKLESCDYFGMNLKEVSNKLIERLEKYLCVMYELEL